MDKGLPGPVFMSVIETLKLGKCVLQGYDCGAVIALRLAATYPTKFCAVIALMPAMAVTPDHKVELKKIKYLRKSFFVAPARPLKT